MFVLGQGSSFKQQATSWSIGLGRYARHALGIIPGETYRKPASHKQLDKIKFIMYRIIKEKIMQTKKMTMQEAINRIREAVEYYDMVHDTGEEKQTLKNKDYVLKGYYRLMEISNENK